jgi:DNA (cytosine-5)-methyltransferase 1
VRYLSVCSGIEAASVAWHPLGWTPAAFSEIEAFPRAVLAHHYPDVPCHGDFTTIGADDYGAIDLLVGGTPCQSFSIAGLRGGLADDRGNLALEYLRLADRKRPRWLVWENVPGVLSIDGGRAFGAILGGMAELGYGFAYRVLDAQHFGVPQRRRRVFVVGYLGDWRRAAAVLFERHSLSGHPAPRREAREAVAALTANGVGTCGADDNQGQAGHLIAFDGQNLADCGDLSATLDSGAAHGNRGMHVAAYPDPAFALSAGNQGKGGVFGSGRDGQDTFVTHSLRAEGFDASEDGTGRGTPLVPVPFDTTQITSAANYSNPKAGDPCHPLAAGMHPPAIAFDCKASGQNGFGIGEVMSTLRSMGHKNSHTNGGGHAAVQTGSAVRRLTPRECERLQGFPDDYTLIPYRNKLAADGPRYKALGNSMAVPVMRWIGERIDRVEALSPAFERAA